MKKQAIIVLLVLLMAVLGIHEDTNASIIDGGTSYYSTPPFAQTFYDVFDESAAIADIQCNVYTYATGPYAGKYAYTYQITNTSDVDLSFVVFSTQIFNDVDVGDSGFEVTDSGDITPNTWGPVGSPTPYGFDAYFSDTILSGEQSALLWFVSDYAPTDAGEGELWGTYMPAGGTEWVGVYAEGNLIVPSTVVPEPTTLEIAVDIQPGSCPNPLRVNFIGNGVFPVAIVGSADFDVLDINVDTITLAGVTPLRAKVSDVSTAGDVCELGPDGIADLVLKFRRTAIIAALEFTHGDLAELPNRAPLTLTLSGETNDGVLIAGTDTLVILNRGRIKRSRR